ncbi:MAG: MlaD family protein [Gemmatimonadota bacterium]|jgi:phospholipid/cholesterol/gamma-HCH transport system substrate-binding protein|nr:MlaD family protein [Gemmatimonadota bacterium]
MRGAGSTLEPPRNGADAKTREAELLAALPVSPANREIKVGFFVLIGLAAFFTSLFTLTDVGTFRGRYYTSTVIESAGGMRSGDPVQMRGVNIGRVTDFDMVSNGVSVRLEIYNRYDVPEDSRVVIRSAGLLGGMSVDVVPGSSSTRANEAHPLVGSVEADLMATASVLGTDAQTVLERATLLLSDSTISSVGASAEEMHALLANLNVIAVTQRAELARLSASLRRSAEGVERATTGPQLERAVTNIDSLTFRLDETTRTLGSASASLETVLGRIERGEGTLGKLTADDTLFENMNDAVLSLQRLVDDVRANPKRYLNVSVF